MKRTSDLVNELLNENRYWTFWKADWSDKRYVYWGGVTKFEEIKDAMKLLLGEDCMYERQVQLKDPDYSFK
jgi:hypothetical protein